MKCSRLNCARWPTDCLAASPVRQTWQDAGRIRGADWHDLLAQLSGLPRPLVGVLTATQQPAEAVT